VGLKKEAKSETAPSFGRLDARQNGRMSGANFLIESLSSTMFAMITPAVMRSTDWIK